MSLDLDPVIIEPVATDELVILGDHPEPRWRDVLAGTTRINPLVTLVLSTLATIAIAAPLWLQAADVPPDPFVATPGGVVVITTDADLQPLNDATIGARALVSYIGTDVAAVAFNLSEANGAVLSERVDTQGPSFDLLTDNLDEPLALDTTKLADGEYELFVSVTGSDGVETLTAAKFTVSNESADGE